MGHFASIRLLDGIAYVPHPNRNSNNKLENLGIRGFKKIDKRRDEFMQEAK